MPAPVLIASDSLFSQPYIFSPSPSKAIWANLRAKERYSQPTSKPITKIKPYHYFLQLEE